MKKGWMMKLVSTRRMFTVTALLAAVAVPLQTMGQVSPAASASPRAAGQTPARQEPSAPAPQSPIPEGAAPTNPFPPVNLKNFTADSPTRDDVNSFLKAIWGYDDNRIWSVAAILKTPAPGVVKVVVFVADKSSPGKGAQTVFFVTPDGKHAIAGNVIDFGAKPFEATRKVLQDRADGPAEGAASKDLLLVEFAGLQCAQCSGAQDSIANLATDFPQARIVFENLPMPETQPYSFRAAVEGVCVRKAKGDAAFFQYVHAVYERQDQMTASGVDAALSGAATLAGADPRAVAACAQTQAAKDDVNASMRLAVDLGIDQTPTLVVNGHILPLSPSVLPYETLKRIVAFQAGQDGIVVHVQPTLSNLK